MSNTEEKPKKILVPPNIEQDCTILVQIDPEDPTDFTGVTGAIGRLEVDETGVLLDLKGNLYRGLFYPGPTALVLCQLKGSENYRVDTVVDEFCCLSKAEDALGRFDAKIQGDMTDYQESKKGQEHTAKIIEDVVHSEAGRKLQKLTDSSKKRQRLTKKK